MLSKKASIFCIILIIFTVLILGFTFIMLFTKERFVLNKKGFKTKMLYKKPDIILIKNFLTDDECDYLINISKPIFSRSTVVTEEGQIKDKIRTSETAHIGSNFLDDKKHSKILNNILDKASLFMNVPKERIEPLQVVKYKSGQFYKPHYDYFDRNLPESKQDIEKNGQRQYTFFVYLTDVPNGNGGTTYFPEIDKHFKVDKGGAIFWSNLVNGKEDPMTLHSGSELKKGIKYGLNIWVRTKKFID